MARFSIIIPVYNVEDYLDTCVESVLCQSFSDFEVLLVDDGSTDSSGKMCDLWAEKDARVRVIHQENQGLSGARNTGIREATGDYVMFLDSDDWWAGEDVLEKIALRLEKTEPEVLSFDYQKSFDGVVTAPYFNRRHANDNTLTYMVEQGTWVNGACNKAVQRELFSDQLFFRMGISSEDMDWTLRLAQRAERFDYLQQVVFVYRQRTTSISHSVSRKRVEDMLENVRHCLVLLEEVPQKKQALLPYVAYQYATVLYNCASLPRKQRRSLDEDMKSLCWLLSESDDNKVRLLKTANRFLGFRGVLQALRIRQALLRG